MSKLLFLYETDMPTVSIARNYYLNLPKEYQMTSKFVRLMDLTVSDLNWCDVLMMIRPNNAFSWAIASRVRSSGRFVVTMCDDDLLHLPKSHPDLPWQRNGLIKALNNSSVILSSSRYLVNQLVGYTADHRSAYSDTVVKPEEIQERRFDDESREGRPVRIVYAAGSKHESLFEQLVLPALKKIAKESPNLFSLTFISVHPDCKGLEKDVQVEYVKGMPLIEYRKYMEDARFDIGISPLEGNAFTRCKYFNKYLEYTLSGIVGIYSNVEPYTYVVQDAENGFLADNNDKSWAEKLSTAIRDPQARISCAKKAQAHVRTTFSEEKIMARLFSDIPELQQQGQTYSICKPFTGRRLFYRLLRCIEFIYKTGFYLKNEGLGSVKRKTLARLKGQVK